MTNRGLAARGNGCESPGPSSRVCASLAPQWGALLHEVHPLNGAPAKAEANLTARWSVVPIFLKPDALEGDATTVAGEIAADFVHYLREAVDSLSFPDDYVPRVEQSRNGALRAHRHATNEMTAISWYVLPLQDVRSVQDRLDELEREWAAAGRLRVGDLLVQTCMALGFRILQDRDRVLTAHDYGVLYGSSDLDTLEKMRPFLVGKRVRLLVLCGQQENSALQIMKTYARYVMRYPTARVRMENWIHVSNPDEFNYPELLKMFFVESGGGD